MRFLRVLPDGWAVWSIEINGFPSNVSSFFRINKVYMDICFNVWK